MDATIGLGECGGAFSKFKVLPSGVEGAL
jgi:hypothetical protein